MRKVALLAFVGLLCVSLSALAGEVITNDTGEDATGLRVIFSTSVTITAFGDTLMQVDQTGASSEFVFSDGTVSPWGSHWMSWTPVAKIISHEWLHGGEQGIKKSALELPTTTITRFPSRVALQVTDTVAKFQPIDGFNEGSTVPVERWYCFSSDGGGILTPPPGATDPMVTYVYSDDNSSGCAVHYQQPIDFSSYKGLRIVASADHPVDMEVVVGICDDTIPKEGDEACGESAALFSTNLSLTQERQEFLLPFDQFKIHPYILEDHPTANLTPNVSGVFDITFHPFGSSGVVEIKEVSGVSQVAPRQVAGVKINDYYFQQPAYVMQGVGDTNAIYALPLKGIPELSTGYVAEDNSGGELIWSVTASDPGIGAGFEDETLYIWGADASWSGYGEVALSVADDDGETDSIIIPVTVFREDKTLTNAEGKTEYFVPWSSELDVNRITSVEKHMETYGKPDLGLLDRTVQFSNWKKMQHINGANLYGWLNQYTHPWYSREAIWRQVDETYRELARIGCNAVYLLRGYYTPERSSPCPIELFKKWTPGLPMTEEDAQYAINEAHRQGFFVLLAPNIAEAPEGRQFYPDDLDAWFDCYAQIVEENAVLSQRTGAEAFALAHILMPAGFAWPNYQRRYENYIRIMQTILSSNVRPEYAGPVAFMPGSHEVDQESMRILPLLHDVDIAGANSNFTGLTASDSPSVDELTQAIFAKCQRFFVPLHERLRKPMFVNEGFTASWDGAIRSFDLSSGPPLGAVYDAAEQANWYRAWFRVEGQFPFLFGFGWANWSFWPGAGGAGELGFTPRLKRAESVVAEAYNAPDPFSTICVDGHPSDWAEVDSEVSGSPSDSRERNGPDLLELSAILDQAYLYISVKLTARAQPEHILQVDLDLDGDTRTDTQVGIFSIDPTDFIPTRRWMGLLYEQPLSLSIISGSVDLNTNGNDSFFEMRVPLSFLDSFTDVSLRANLTNTQSHMQLDQTDWLEITSSGDPTAGQSAAVLFDLSHRKIRAD